jgi:hypothetical protein
VADGNTADAVLGGKLMFGRQAHLRPGGLR